MSMAEKRTLSIEARVKDFATKSFKKMGKSVKTFVTKAVGGFVKMIRKVASLKGALTGLIALFAARAVVNFGLEILNQVDLLGQWARKLKVSATQLSELKFAASQTGLEFDQLVEGMKTIQERMDDAARGTKTYAEHFANLGLDVTDAGGNLKNVADFLPELAAAVKDAADKGTDLTLFFEDVVGGSEHMLELLLKQGPDALRFFGEEAHRLGIIIDDDMVKKSREWNRTWDKLKTVINSVSIELLTELAPALSTVANKLAEFIAANKDKFVDWIKAIGLAILHVIDVLTDAFINFIDFIENSWLGPGNLLDMTKTEAELEKVRKKLEAIGTMSSEFVKPLRIKIQAELEAGGMPASEARKLARQQVSLGRLGLHRGPEGKFQAPSAGPRGPLSPETVQAARALSEERQKLQRRIEEIELGLQQGLGAMLRRTKENMMKEISAAMEFGGGGGAPARPPGGEPGGEPAGAAPKGGGMPAQQAGLIQRRQAVIAFHQSLLALVQPTRAVQIEMAKLSAENQALAIRAQHVAGSFGDVQESAPAVAAGIAAIAVELDKTVRRLEGDFWLGFEEGATKALEAWTDFTAAASQATSTLIDSGLNGLTNALTDVITGTKSAKDAFKEFGLMMLKTLVQVIVKLLIVKTLGGIFGGVFAGGGIMAGEVQKTLPLRGYAKGGVATSPQMAIFGEGRSKAEAFVPLPDGRSIPVTLAGGRGPAINISINAMDGQDVHRVLVKNRSSILGIYSHALASSQDSRQAVQRAAS
jgi:hypothetical protein